jgi:hypothetical protein
VADNESRQLAWLRIPFFPCFFFSFFFLHAQVARDCRIAPCRGPRNPQRARRRCRSRCCARCDPPHPRGYVLHSQTHTTVLRPSSSHPDRVLTHLKKPMLPPIHSSSTHSINTQTHKPMTRSKPDKVCAGHDRGDADPGDDRAHAGLARGRRAHDPRSRRRAHVRCCSSYF